MDVSRAEAVRARLATREPLIMDGAMGTQLQALGLPPGVAPELLNLQQPELVTTVHRSYLEAGAEIILSNTFGASQLKLARHGLLPEIVIPRAIELAQTAVEASGRDAWVAFDCGPLGTLLEPGGSLRFEEAYEAYAGQIRLATSSGADLLIFETQTDLYELKAALLAAHEHSSLPVIASMSFEPHGRSFSGADLASFVALAESLHADILGLNCSSGPEELLPLVEQLLTLTEKPVMLRPNAGLPDPESGLYDVAAEAYARTMELALERGVLLAGGCCGTTPEFIRQIQKPSPRQPASPPPRGSCSSATQTVYFGERPLIVSEVLNPTGKPDLKQALETQNYEIYARIAVEQEAAGADILDINCGHPGIQEAEAMAAVVRTVQAVSHLPLQLDSNKPEVLEAGLRVVNGKPIINSVTGTAESLATVLPLAARYGAALILLPIDEQGIPPTAEGRLTIFRTIVDRCLQLGIRREDLIADCLLLTAAAEPLGPSTSLRTLALVKQQLGLHTILGLSNVSFGLPERRSLNQVYYAQALAQGLDLVIANPAHPELLTTRAAHQALSGQDPGQTEYLAHVRKQPTSTDAPPATAATLRHAILSGLESDAEQLARQALQTRSPFTLIEEEILPALDQAGQRYEAGTSFLPQLLRSSHAAQAALHPIRQAIAAAPSDPEQPTEPQTIILATVQGDIHDIGKNIVRTLLENYGYRILDLGKDVAPTTIVTAAQRESARLVGLSALMTSTLPAMAETIRLLKTSVPDCQVMVGGAVVTPEYAASIGADHYCPDARSGVTCAREIFQAQQ